MPDAEGKLTTEELRERWRYTPGKEFREKILKQLKDEEEDYTVDWDNLEVSVEGEPYLWKDFKGVNELIELEDISDPRLVDLYFVNELIELEDKLRDLRGVNFCDKQLQHANLVGAHLEYANLLLAHLEHADLLGAHLEHAGLWLAHLEHADLNHATFLFKSFWWRIKELFIKERLLNDTNHPTKLSGASLKNVKLDSDPILYRDLLDEQYLDRFAEKHTFLYPFWLLTSNCGRWTSLVFVWAFVIALKFGFIYSQLRFVYFGDITLYEWWYPFYLSFVTMTTLGMASVEPATTSAAVFHTIENFFGYALLGYAIAVFGSKFTRRSA